MARKLTTKQRRFVEASNMRFYEVLSAEPLARAYCAANVKFC